METKHAYGLVLELLAPCAPVSTFAFAALRLGRRTSLQLQPGIGSPRAFFRVTCSTSAPPSGSTSRKNGAPGRSSWRAQVGSRSPNLRSPPCAPFFRLSPPARSQSGESEALHATRKCSRRALRRPQRFAQPRPEGPGAERTRCRRKEFRDLGRLTSGARKYRPLRNLFERRLDD